MNKNKNNIFKFVVHNKVWSKDRSHKYDKKVYDKIIKGSLENVYTEVERAIKNYLREDGWIRLDCLYLDPALKDMRYGSTESKSLSKDVSKGRIGGVEFDLSNYGEQYHGRIIEELRGLGKDIDNYSLVDRKRIIPKGRIPINIKDFNYVMSICTYWDEINRMITEDHISVGEQYEYALKCIDNLCLTSTNEPPRVKIGNPNEGTPFQLLWHLASELCNSHYTTDLIQSVLKKEDGSLRYPNGFKFNEKGNVTVIRSDKNLVNFTRTRLAELGLDKYFSFKSRKIELKDEYRGRKRK